MRKSSDRNTNWSPSIWHLLRLLRHTDYSHTATIIAQNCLPPDMKYKLCDVKHIQPSLQRLQNKKKNQAVEQTVGKVYDQVDKFIMSNPYGLLGISPNLAENQFRGALNSNGIPSLYRIAEQFPMFRLMRSINTTLS
ncbi:hypothetical protein U1Q18_051293 [Sarracenia purpurea var. burkii]